jgi:hypothetical protein
MHSRAAEAAAISVVAIILTAVMAAPVIMAPSERIFGAEIVGRHHDPFSVMSRFTNDLGVGVYRQPLTDAPGALFARVMSPVAAYNWLVLLTFPLSALTAFALGRHLALAPVPAGIAAIVFAFSPFHLAHAAYHPHVAQTQWLPLYFLALWRCIDRPTTIRVATLGLAIVGVTLSNFYGGLIAVVLTPAAIGAYWVFTSRHRVHSNRRIATALGSLAVFVACGAAYAWSTSAAVVTNPDAFAYSRADVVRHSALWWSYFVPPVEHPVLGAVAERIWSAAGVGAGLLEQQVSIGFGVMALGVIAGSAWLHGHRHPASLAAVPVLAWMGIVALLCSLSPDLIIGRFSFRRPSAFVYDLLPMFRAYARFGVVVQLAAALLAAIGVERLWRSGNRASNFACGALLLLAAGEYVVSPGAHWRDVLPTKAHRWVAQQQAHMQVLDCAPLTPASASVQWLSGNRISLGSGWFADCTEPNFIGKLSAAGYSHVLVRQGTRESRRFNGRHQPDGVKLVARFEDGDVFGIIKSKPPVFTAEMRDFYAREYNGSWTWRWMENTASWKVINRSDSHVEATVDLQMRAFDHPRTMKLHLDGKPLQTVVIPTKRGFHRIGPLLLAPGAHILGFHAAEPSTAPNTMARNGDARPLSFALGDWRWNTVDEHR